jgi:uncharacterized protein DUF2510/fibronectin type III domain protein
MTDQPGTYPATPPAVPAAWYADPSGRHEIRYWDGTAWTVHVADKGVVAIDTGEPTAPPLPAPVTVPAAAASPVSTPAPKQVTAPVAAPGAPDAARRGRRGWVVAAVAGVAVLGLIAGLVIWAPWRSPPLLRPTGLAAGPSTTNTVSFHWSRPATGPAPDQYLILHDGQLIDAVPGNLTSYTATNLAPATAYQYRVAAERGGKRSAPSAVLTVRTITPPVSAGRLQGPWTVAIHVLHTTGNFQGSRRWSESWVTSPECTAGPCPVRLSGSINRHKFVTTLTQAGTGYKGKFAGNVFPCGTGANSFPIRSTVRLRLTVTQSHVDALDWAASSWAGTMVVTSPYTSSGNFFCPASTLTATLAGNP